MKTTKKKPAAPPACAWCGGPHLSDPRRCPAAPPADDHAASIDKVLTQHAGTMAKLAGADEYDALLARLDEDDPCCRQAADAIRALRARLADWENDPRTKAMDVEIQGAQADLAAARIDLRKVNEYNGQLAQELHEAQARVAEFEKEGLYEATVLERDRAEEQAARWQRAANEIEQEYKRELDAARADAARVREELYEERQLHILTISQRNEQLDRAERAEAEVERLRADNERGAWIDEAMANLARAKRAEGLARELAGALHRVEFVAGEDGDDCGFCWRFDGLGHSESCEVRAALARAREVLDGNT